MQPTGAGSNEGHVAHPCLVGFESSELTLEKIGCRRQRVAMLHADTEPTPAPRLDVRFTAQSRNTVLATAHALKLQRTPRPPNAVRLVIGRVHAADRRQKYDVFAYTCRRNVI